MSDYPGGDTVGIVTKLSTGQKDSMGQAVTADSVVWVYGCVFETERISEEQSDTITSNERGWAWLPYIPGIGIPTVDDDGNELVDGEGNPVTVEITNANWIRPKRWQPMAARDYKVFGMPAVEFDGDGQPDHVWIICEWHAG
jgi:hypothetical protein